MKPEELIKLYNEKVDSFSEEELTYVSTFFNEFYAKKYIKSREDAFDILINEGLPKAISKLDSKSQKEIKKKILSL